MIDLKNISVQFSGQYLFEDVNLKILPQDRIALVGSNGTEIFLRSIIYSYCKDIILICF
jgi:ABC-type phosphate/phosphonate transport system ATPase subunit